MASIQLILGFLDLGQNIQQWLEWGSYFLLFGLLFACGLGLPLPEDIPLLGAGAMIAQGKMNVFLAATCAWGGIVGGDIVLYHLGKKFGLEVRRLPMIGRHLSQKRLDKVHGMFEKYGIWVVAIGRLFAGIRGAMVVVAGAIRFTFWKFLVTDGLAAMVSGGAFLYLGYFFGNHFQDLIAHVEKGKHWALIGACVVAVVAGVWFYLRQKKRGDHDEPGSGEPATEGALPESAAE